MAWQQWTYLVLTVLGAASMARLVGKPREPYKGRDLAIQIITSALLVALILSI